ncbi:MAG: S9 family peptidase [Lysobacteraceae bacterium]|nr:MAG: S9 family peptidase [Xanthomonadaceae bacterium]
MRVMDSMRHVAIALALLASPVVATAAAKVPVASFAAQQTYDNPRISSGGSYVAVSADLGDDDHGIMVFRLSDMAQTAFIKLPRYQLAIELHWVSDTRLVYVKGGKWGAREQPFDFGEIIAMDFDGKKHTYIFGYKATTQSMGLEPGHGNFAGLPPKANGKFYMTRTSVESALGRSQLYEVDATTSRHRLVADVGGNQNLSFVMDANGVARFAYGVDKNDVQLLYVADAKGENWRKLPGDAVGGVFEPIAFTPDGQQVFGTFAIDGGPRSLVKADLSLSKREVLASDGFNDVASVVWDSNRQPLAVEFKGALPRVQFLDPASADAKLYQEIRSGFPGQHVKFADHSEDGNVSLVYIYSDRNPGEWAVMNRKKDNLARLLQRNAAIDPTAMGGRHYVRFKASDGVELDAYVTVPAGVTELKAMPMVLLPHGGPHYVSDQWGFDTDAQFLASRGYLVLQVNYRGSGDRGYSFQEAGHRQWGGRIQDDLVDGMRWAIAKGYADPGRICVFGASFGGYSALMLAAKAPDLVKCAAGLSGLYDLRSMANKSDTAQSFLGRSYIERVIGRDDAELLANSPLSRVAGIKAPVFLAHGEADERTPYRQADAMAKSLQKAGNKPVWMSVPKEGHGFYAEKNVVAFYNQLEDFLAANIGAGGR